MPKEKRKGTLPGGTNIGPWRCQRFINGGGQGEVYQVTYSKARRDGPCALKIVVDGDTKELARFAGEVRALRALDHRHLVPILDAGDFEFAAFAGRTLPYYVMPLAEATLADRRVLLMGLHQRLRLFRQILAGVDHMHAQGMFHRDLKPSNVLLFGKQLDEARVSDLGIVKTLVSEPGLSATLEVFGSRQYIAPELLGGGTASAQSDVYSLGVMLAELTAQDRDEPNHEIDPEVIDGISALVHDASSREHRTRTQSVAAMLDQLPEITTYLKKRPVPPQSQKVPSLPTAPPFTSGQSIGHLRETGLPVAWSGGSHLALCVASVATAARSWTNYELQESRGAMPFYDDGHGTNFSRTEFGMLYFTPPAREQNGVQHFSDCAHVSRDGTVWALNSTLCSASAAVNGDKTQKVLPAGHVERWFIQALDMARDYLRKTLAVPAPYAWRASARHVQSYLLELPTEHFSRRHSARNYDDVIALGGELSDTVAPIEVLRPFFDVLWQSFGTPRPASPWR
jgi:hypothetical protein